MHDDDITIVPAPAILVARKAIDALALFDNIELDDDGNPDDPEKALQAITTAIAHLQGAASLLQHQIAHRPRAVAAPSDPAVPSTAVP